MNKTINAEWTRRHFFAGLTAAGVAGGLVWNGETAWLQQAVDERQVSGFLGDYSKLIPVPNNGDLLFYEEEPGVLKNYRKFIFDPVNIYLLPESRAHAIDADDLYRLAEFFRQTVVDELKQSKYEFVDATGPGALELNVAISDVSPTGGTRNAVVAGAATAGSIMTVPGIGLVVPRISVGRISIEGEMLDSVSGERKVAFMTSKGGRRWFSGLNRFRTWGDIERAFRTWARNFRQRMDAAHAAS